MTEFIVHHNKKIAYTNKGKGNALLFIHGFCEDKTMWQDFVIPFEESHQVITIDISGFGESELQTEISILDMSEQVNRVLDILNIKKCCLIGHSMGGYIALAFAEKYPEKLSGLVLFHTHPFADSKEKKLNREKAIDFIIRNGSEPFVRQLIPTLFRVGYAKSNRKLVNEMIQKANNYPSAAITTALKAMKYRPDRSMILEKINVPVLFIIGKKDNAVTWAQSLRQSHLPKISKVAIFENVGHQGMFEAKEATQQTFRDWINVFSI